MRKLPRLLVICVLGLAVHDPATSAQAQALQWIDHIHLSAPDQAEGVAWYKKHFGGEPVIVTGAKGEKITAPDRLFYGKAMVAFQRRMPGGYGSKGPSAGAMVDSIGFSVNDVDATIRAFQAEGIKILQPVHDVPGLFKSATIEDPWGVSIEVVQDRQKLGLHHVHVKVPDPQGLLKWMVREFGGTIAKMNNRIDGIKYDDVWVLVEKGEGAAIMGYAIDHFGFRAENLKSYLTEARARGVVVSRSERDAQVGPGSNIHNSYVDAPIPGFFFEMVDRCPDTPGGCTPYGPSPAGAGGAAPTAAPPAGGRQ